MRSDISGIIAARNIGMATPTLPQITKIRYLFSHGKPSTSVEVAYNRQEHQPPAKYDSYATNKENDCELPEVLNHRFVHITTDTWWMRIDMSETGTWAD
jgi:hypothetical protein